MALRPPVKWHGGKRYLASRIIQHFPGHRVYLEPFGGGASVLLNKEPVEVETYNDLDWRITRLFRVLRDSGEDFVRKVSLIPYSQVEFESAAEYPGDDASDTEMAICDFVRWRQGQVVELHNIPSAGRNGGRCECVVDCYRIAATNH